MFYIKTKRGNSIPIEDGEDGNVFTTCPDCGAEFHVRLADVICNEELDLYSTQMLCPNCTSPPVPCNTFGDFSHRLWSALLPTEETRDPPYAEAKKDMRKDAPMSLNF